MKVGVIGAGTMGSGIAQAFAQTEGYEVYLCDINDEFAANGKKKIAKGFEKRVARGKMDQAKADAILAKITTGTKDICTDADLVVEAALEVWKLNSRHLKNYRISFLQHVCLQQIHLLYLLHRSVQDLTDQFYRNAFLQPGSSHEAC